MITLMTSTARDGYSKDLEDNIKKYVEETGAKPLKPEIIGSTRYFKYDDSDIEKTVSDIESYLELQYPQIREMDSGDPEESGALQEDELLILMN